MLRRKIHTAGLAVLFSLLLGITAGCGADSSSITLPGVVEGDMGQQVAQGDILAVLDRGDAENSAEQLKAVLAQKQAALDLLKKGADVENIAQASNQITVAQQQADSASASWQKAQEDCGRTEKLYAEGAVSLSELETAQLKRDTAQDAVKSAQAQVSGAREQKALLEKGADEAALRQAEAAVLQAQLQVSQAEDHLKKYTIYASCTGTIASLNFSEGDMISTGNDLADISDAGRRYLTAYLPEEMLAQVEYGDKAAIISGHDNREEGQLAYIGLTAEYTPKDLRGQANKNKESIKIRIQLSTDSALKPGEEAQVELRLDLQ